MPTFAAHDGTELAYHVFGEGSPVVCLPGGPMQDSAYLGDLGGLSEHRQLVMLDLRGTGRSAEPHDTASCRCDRLVDDVEALREHLGLERLDLLAHSAGTNVAVQYLARHPERVGKLALITPSVLAVGITVTADLRRETARSRDGEAWFPSASAALEEIIAGNATADAWREIDPFLYGRWDDAAREHRAAAEHQKNHAAANVFFAEGAFDPDRTRAAVARFQRPVLLLAGQVDLNSPPDAMAEFAALFPHADLVVQHGAGHFPWLDDTDRFVSTTTEFLS
ncbi:pimeloyl-ACP methyl ester carboxylesterase [Haloactinopolyspora alba]|uniref:Pimeloyl-ACP methyl ester carboxylesterase n=1 Tax=Haloactinopolyspora alba TaxID=648780 RepID=A0A2P8DY55_9ACTN|nr:alpha/beta hydrolase [Haloactinopolyspora alba]PSL02132.1 pimeloyl-ACP methyl ester carboxylesterase [Haloactinopolyspora alba]